jgi:hypothetical protein
MRGASSTMPLTVKQVVDAQQSGTGEKGAPFVVDGVEMANVRGPKFDTPLPQRYAFLRLSSSSCFDSLICTCSRR